MCGLTSIISWQNPVAEDKIKAGLNAITHRGPDDQGIWLSNNGRVALGHQRLSIIDLNTGKQPLSTVDKSVHAIVNGEFYGYQTIRTELINKGHQFQTNSDSEILIHLYQEYGTECLQYLNGEFAFILWDEAHEMLFVARDRFGVKPLCYTQRDDGLYMASEAKALFAMGIKAQWDEYSFYHSANLQYTPQDRTLFKDIKQLQPGHMMIVKGHNVHIEKYWDMDYPSETETRPITASDETAYIKTFHDLFKQSVETRLNADVPLCFHLSGGIDSSAVLGLASNIMDKPLDAFTVCFEHKDYDEFEQAQEMAQYANANFHPIHVSQEDLVTSLPDAVYHGEGLAINGHFGAKYMLNKAIKKAGFKVALTGEGADEVLAGYPHLRQDLFSLSNNTEQIAELYQSNTASAGVQLSVGDELNTDALQTALGYRPHFLKAKASLGYKMCSILSQDYQARFTGTDCYQDLMDQLQIKQQLEKRHIVHQSLYIWSKLTLANYILRTLGDGMEMSCSIEGRLPFLDNKLFDFLRNLPMGMKIKDGTEKYILREAMKPYITKTIYKRQKHPFMAPPISRFSNKALDAMIQDTIRGEGFKAVPFFDRKKVLDMLNKLPNMNNEALTAMEPVLMMILTTTLMHQKFKL